ncbi:MAG: hypothetical protein ABIZ04_04375 [Opitutus sp.]
MRKLLNNPKIVAALALVAAACVGVSLMPKGTQSSGQTAEPTALASEAAAEPITAELSTIAVETAAKETPVAVALVDPFGPRTSTSNEPAAELPPLPDSVDTVRLSAIWTQRDQTFVLINGEVHQAGDEISRIKIESATQDGVWVAHWKGRDFLTLGTDFTLVTPGRRPHVEASL